MNERIWQLQGQAKVLAEEIVSQRKYDDYMEYKQSLMDHTMNKFAELIIRECITRIEGCATIPDDDEFVKGYNKGVSKVASQVKHHFGVEE